MARSLDVIDAELESAREGSAAGQQGADATARLSADTVATEQFPCSLGQRRFWILDQLDPGNPALNVAVRWRLEGAVSVAQLERALQHIIARHSVLRTGIAAVDGTPVQVVQPHGAFRIPVIDLSTLPAADADREAQRIASREARSSFNLAVPPLIRVTLLRLRERVWTVLVTAHHIICDGWSIGVLTRELAEICAAEHSGRPPELPQLPVSYGDYAAWQNDWAESAERGEDADFWVRTLRGAAAFEVLPDHPRPPVLSTHGDIESRLLDRSLTDRLAGFARRRGYTLFMVSMAALLALLKRYTAAEDITIGTQVAGREDPDLEPLVGMFINTLVLRFELPGDPTVAALCEQVSQVVLNAFEHQQMPIEKLIEILKPQRDSSRNTLFSVNFIFQRSFIRNACAGSFELLDMPSVSAGAMYDLNFFMVERPDGWRASCEFNTDLFERATVSRMLGHFIRILGALAADDAQTLARLPMISESEQAQLLATRNATAFDYPKHAAACDLFAAQVRRSPNAAALVCADRSLSYGELDAAANRLARFLRKRGVHQSARVGVFFERSPELVIALLGVMKAGCAYIPLDPIYPQDRLRHVIEDSGMSALLSTSGQRHLLPDTRVPLVLLDTDAPEIAMQSPLVAALNPSETDIAYVMYTSGSTGKPKGVQIPHVALTNFLCSMQREPGLGADDTLLAVTTVSFDIAALEIFLPLVTGAKLVIARSTETVDGRELLALLQRHSVSVMQAAPVTWQLLLDGGWRGQPALKMLCGGEALPRKLANELLECGGELWNMYGPTETTIWSSVLKVTRGEHAVPVGPPIANTQFYVLDPHANPVPVGVAGELVIGGDGVARGYVNLPDLTAQKFPPDKFRTGVTTTLYRTGDVVRARADGTFEFLGRTDHQIKLRGFRIELGEIETALLSHPDVAEAVAHAGRTGAGDPAIFAYVAPRLAISDPQQLLGDLRLRLQGALPAYMLPSSITVLDVLPRTPNGKIDRKALPAPQERALRVVQSPVNETERRLVEIWRGVLGVETIDRTANFFELGGHSVLAARLAARVETEFGHRLSLAMLFKAPSIAEQAQLIESDGGRQFDFRQVVKLQPNGARLPIIAVNNTGIFYVLSKRLGSDQPFTCLQLFDPANDDVPLPDTLEELAAEYVRLIRSVQPNGPYAFLGWCVAGALTFEIARQISTSGQEVAMLAMVDTWAPGHLHRLGLLRGRLTDWAYRFCLVRKDFRRLRQGQQGWRTFIGNRVLFKRLAGLFGRPLAAVQPSIVDRAQQETPEAYDQWLLKYLGGVLKHYEPKVYRGKVSLFRSGEEPHGLWIDKKMGWRPFALEGVDVVVVPGDHYSVFNDPGVKELAAAIHSLLGAYNVKSQPGRESEPI
jgi:amino acid adenylation domain-containing protein